MERISLNKRMEQLVKESKQPATGALMNLNGRLMLKFASMPMSLPYRDSTCRKMLTTLAETISIPLNKVLSMTYTELAVAIHNMPRSTNNERMLFEAAVLQTAEMLKYMADTKEAFYAKQKRT